MGDAADMAMEAESFRSSYGDGTDDSLILPTGGWSLRQCHLTNDDLPAFTVQRGGIKYPTPTKEATVPKQTKAQIEHELKVNQGLMEALLERRNQLHRELKTARPPAPASNQHRWTIGIRFTRGGKIYEFLVIRVGDYFYTTGTADSARFSNWAAFLDWLDEKTVEHSAMIPLLADYGATAPLEGKKA